MTIPSFERCLRFGLRLARPIADRSRAARRRQLSGSQNATAAANGLLHAVRPAASRPRLDGKFFAVGDARLWVRRVTYGTFAPDDDGVCFGSGEQVRRDFAAMAEHGFNVVRTYTAPPVWLLDEAHRNDLYVMAGLAWEQQCDLRVHEAITAEGFALDSFGGHRKGGTDDVAQTGQARLASAAAGTTFRTHPQPERRDE